MTILEGFIRTFSSFRPSKGQTEARFTFLESLAVSQVEPPSLEATRAGRRFFIGYNGTAPTGIAPVQAFPTTAAQWVIWNNDPTQSYTMTMLGAILFSGTKGLGGQLLATLFSAPAQTGASATGLAVMGGLNKTSQAIIKSGVTITTPSAPVWTPVAEDTLAVATVGPANCMINRNLEGKIIVPPQSGLGLAVLAPAGTTPLYLPMGEWIETNDARD